MINLKSGLRRLNTENRLESEMSSALESLEYSIPVLEISEAQDIRLRPDYEDLLAEMYLKPELENFELPHEVVSYTIEEISVHETGNGISYAVNRFLDRTDFSATICIELDFDQTLRTRSLHKHPGIDDTDIRFESTSSDEMSIYFEVTNPDDVISKLAVFNWALASQWNLPNTIQGLIEHIAEWEAFNAIHQG